MGSWASSWALSWLAIDWVADRVGRLSWSLCLGVFFVGNHLRLPPGVGMGCFSVQTHFSRLEERITRWFLTLSGTSLCRKGKRIDKILSIVSRCRIRFNANYSGVPMQREYNPISKMFVESDQYAIIIDCFF
jgi:hypothetical protein